MTFRLRKIRRIISDKIRNFKLLEMPKLSNFRLPEGRYFRNCDKTELKISLYFFFCFRTASLSGSGLSQIGISFYSKTHKLSEFEVSEFLLGTKLKAWGNKESTDLGPDENDFF